MDDPVPTLRRTRRSKRVLHDQITKAAGAEFEANGFGGATTAAIARRADVTEAQVFRMFGSKQGLFRAAIFDPLNARIAAFAQARPTAADAATHAQIAMDYTRELQAMESETDRGDLPTLDSDRRLRVAVASGETFEAGGSDGRRRS